MSSMAKSVKSTHVFQTLAKMMGLAFKTLLQQTILLATAKVVFTVIYVKPTPAFQILVKMLAPARKISQLQLILLANAKVVFMEIDAKLIHVIRKIRPFLRANVKMAEAASQLMKQILLVGVNLGFMVMHANSRTVILLAIFCHYEIRFI